MQQRVYHVTREGLAQLREQLEQCAGPLRKDIAERLHAAKMGPNPQHDAEYESARTEQETNERRIHELEEMIRFAMVIDEERARSSDVVTLGSRVRVRYPDGAERAFQIVGSVEADPVAGRISNESPMGRALAGKAVGEEAAVRAPNGLTLVEVVAIE